MVLIKGLKGSELPSLLPRMPHGYTAQRSMLEADGALVRAASAGALILDLSASEMGEINRCDLSTT